MKLAKHGMHKPQIENRLKWVLRADVHGIVWQDFFRGGKDLWIDLHKFSQQFSVFWGDFWRVWWMLFEAVDVREDLLILMVSSENGYVDDAINWPARWRSRKSVCFNFYILLNFKFVEFD